VDSDDTCGLGGEDPARLDSNPSYGDPAVDWFHCVDIQGYGVEIGETEKLN
jgi:hypothetical protein